MTSSTMQDPGLHVVNAPRTLWGGTVRDVQDVWQSRELLRALTARDLRSRYKGSALGWIWALIRPLVMLLVYGLAVGIFLGASRSIPDFMVYIYAGLIAWTLFATIVTGCISSVVNNGSLLTKSSFPRLLLPLAALGAALVDFVLQTAVLTVGYVIVGDWPTLPSLVYLPRALLILVLFALGIGLMLSAANVYVRDIGFLTDVGLQVGFWLTPVVYSYGQVVQGAEAVGWASDAVTRLYMLNPMANVALAFQRALWPPAAAEGAASFAFPGRLDLRLWVFTLVAAAVAWLGVRVYVKLAGNFGQEL